MSDATPQNVRDNLGTGSSHEDNISLAFVGQLVSNGETFEDPAFSRAGQMFQENLLVGLKRAGIAPSAIISAFPVQAFPRSRRLLFCGDSKTISEGLRVLQVPFFNITPLKELTIGIATMLSLIKWAFCSRGKRRVVLTYNLTVPPGVLTLLAARLIRAKSIVAIYDINVPGETVPRNLWRRLDYRLQRWLLPRYDGHVAVTDSIMHDFAPARHYLVLEGAVSGETLKRSHVAPIKYWGGRTFTIVAAGTLNKTNGIPEILKAFSLLTGESYRLIIAGDGPLRKAVEDAAAEDSRIRYAGYLQFGDVLELYRCASVLICMRMTKQINTRYFFPSKVMEYMASGVPVVCTCTRHLEGEYGEFLYLLHDETAEGLADLLRQVAESDPEERYERARKGRAFLASHKTWDAQGRKVAEYVRTQVLGMQSDFTAK